MLRVHADALYESIRAFLSTHDPDDVRARIEHALRHVVPSWSAVKPDCPGWYWHRPSGIAEPRLVLVDHGRIDTKLMADLGPPNHLVDVQRIDGLWAGPLLPPT